MNYPVVSCFINTTRPCFKVPSAPEDKQFVHFPIDKLGIDLIFDAIKNQKWKPQLEAIKKAGYEKNKTRLPCFTPSGTFRTRSDWDLIEYSGVVHLDYDDLNDLNYVRDRVIRSPYTLAAFISPSGKGLKVFVRVDSRADFHAQAFNQVRAMFDDLVQVKSDSTAMNLSRLCYVSSDSDLYLNNAAEVFKTFSVNKKRTVIPDVSVLANPTGDKLFAWLFNLTSKGKFKKETFPAGYSNDNRNNFIFLFSCNCNRYGIDQNTCQSFVEQIWIMNNEAFSEAELRRTVNSAYSNRQEFGTFNLPKQLQS